MAAGAFPDELRDVIESLPGDTRDRRSKRTPRKMRIALFADCFPSISETFILRQITGLLDLGHEVDVYAEMRPDEDSPLHPDVTQYNLLARTTYMDMPMETGYWELPVWPITGRTWPPGSETPILNVVRVLRAIPKLTKCVVTAPRLTIEVLNPSEYGYQAQSLSALYRLAKLCRRPDNYDLLHAHYGPIGKNFRFARTLWNAPSIVTFHGYDFSSWPRREGRGTYSKLFETVDAVTTHSDHALQELRMLGCPPSKLHRLPVSSVDTSEFPFRERVLKPDEPARILTVARLVEKKGLDYSIRAVAQVSEAHPEIRYDIIGEGPLRSKIEALIQQLGMERSINLHGAHDRDYVRRLIAEAHLFILASVTATDGDQEGTPVSLMEAQASGLPVLSTRHSGIPEVVLDGQSGFLVPERDVSALAERLIYLLNHPQVWPEMGRSGRKHIEEGYDIRKLALQQVELYQATVKEYQQK